MMNKMRKTVLILLMVFAMLLAEGVTVFAWEEGQETDIDNLDASEWMNAIPDEAFISALNIPGAHDAGLFNARWGFGSFAQCQSLSIAQQLEAGVRFFDIRLRYGGDPDDFYDDGEIHENYVCHGQGVFCCDGYKANGDNYTYADVLDEMASFLETHESEAIFFFVRNEVYDKDDEDSLEEDACYQTVLKENEDEIIERFSAEGKEDDFVYLNYAAVPDGTMGDYRGKIMRFPNGVGFGDLMNGKYNDFEASYADKWNVIKPYFDSAEAQTLYTPKLKMKSEFRCAYTSCTGQYTYNKDGKKVWNNVGLEMFDIFDWFDESLMTFPTGSAEAEEMNKLLLSYPFIRGAYYGWIAMDMVTEDLARTIFQTNDFNGIGMVVPPKTPTYIKDIAGFCDISYDDAVERCYAAGYTPVPAKVTSKGRVLYDINPEGDPIVLGYTTTTNPDGAITDIVGRFDSNEPGGYEKVLVYNSMYNFFTRHSDFFSETTYLFVSRSRSGTPITGLAITYTDEGTAAGMVSMDLDNDKPVGSNKTFNLQEGVEDDDDNDIFIGLKMIRDRSENGYGTFFGMGNIVIIIACTVILALAVLLMLEKKKNNKLQKQLKQ